MTSPRPVIAALLSALIPGAGQLYAGRRRRGWILLGISLLLLAVAGGFWFQGKVFVLKLAFRPTALLWLLVANAALFTFRAYAVFDAYLVARGRSLAPIHAGPAIGAAAFMAVLAGGALIAPHAAVGYYDLVQYDLITSVFDDDGDVFASDTNPPPDDGAAAGANDGDGTSEPGAVTGATVVTTTTEPPPPPPLWEPGERYNILLMGGDAGVGRRGVRTDTMIVASVDPETGWAAMFAVPRNVVRIPLPPPASSWDCNCFPRIANELYDYGVNNPDKFPGARNPGAEAVKTALGELLGITIHNYALVNLDGFVAMIDAIGGVTINVPQRVYDPEYPHEDGSFVEIDIPAGIHRMDGHTALAYARSRRLSDDYNRMGRQRCVLEAVMEEADPPRLLLAFPRLAEIIKENVDTDIPIRRVPDIIELATKVDTEEIVVVSIEPPIYNAGWTEDRYPYPNVALIREHVGVIFELSPAEAIARLGLSTLDETCGLSPEELATTTTTSTTTTTAGASG